MPPKESIEQSEYAPIIRRGDQLEQHTLFAPELLYARWGLVPNEYCSTRDADRFRLHAIRFERMKFSRPLCNIYPNRRCLIPSTGLFLDGVDRLEPGAPRWLAGIWTRFLRPMQRVESFHPLDRDGSRDCGARANSSQTLVKPSDQLKRVGRFGGGLVDAREVSTGDRSSTGC